MSNKNNENKNDNKSLFLYTALIFAAAILIIIVASLSQGKLLKAQNDLISETPVPNNEGISHRTTMVSEQNALLITQNETLTALNNELSNDKSELEAKNEELRINYSNGNILCTIYQYIYDGNKDDALESLNLINEDSLTDAQKIIYNNLRKILN